MEKEIFNSLTCIFVLVTISFYPSDFFANKHWKSRVKNFRNQEFNTVKSKFLRIGWLEKFHHSLLRLGKQKIVSIPVQFPFYTTFRQRLNCFFFSAYSPLFKGHDLCISERKTSWAQNCVPERFYWWIFCQYFLYATKKWSSLCFSLYLEYSSSKNN